MMKQKKVKFVSADEAKEFVSIASGCDFDVNVFYNRMSFLRPAGGTKRENSGSTGK